MDLCEIVLDEEDEDDENAGELRISSDVKDVEPEPAPVPAPAPAPAPEPAVDSNGGSSSGSAAVGAGVDGAAGGAAEAVAISAAGRIYPFPLRGGPFLCSQGFGGAFTHFYPGTQHAIDFECAVGTLVLAVGAGVVTETSEDNTETGIHVHNLFKWNSVMLHLDDGMFVEYVHIQHKSCRVKPGDRVVKGQVLCESGDVGFCPTPHLHLQMHGSGARDAPTVPFALEGPDGGPPYIPVAGIFYPPVTPPPP
jgi:murein DD-endopeptidase MepM/ murein hydrolase activator NlpD